MANKYDYFQEFDPYLEDTSPSIDPIVDRLKAEILATGKITRWQPRYTYHLKLIFLNLIDKYRLDPDMYISYSRNKSTYTKMKKSRYKSHLLLYGAMVTIIDILKDDLGYVEGVLGYYFKNKTRNARMRATARLYEFCFISDLNLIALEISRSDEEESIILKTTKYRPKRKEIIEYEDNENTNAMRENLRVINNEISQHFLGIKASDETLEEIRLAMRGIKNEDNDSLDDLGDLDSVEEAEINTNGETSTTDSYAKDSVGQCLDFSKIKLKRIFNNGSFEQGGRFYGTWWQAVPSRYRDLIVIDDEPTIEVDFCGIHINLLYLESGLELPVDDVYTVEGLPADARKVLKVALQIMLNSDNEAKALRSIRRKFPIERYPYLFNDFTHEQIINAFKVKHAGISEYFYTGEGIKLQFIDSQIAERTLLLLQSKGIVALPIHDSFIVKETEEELLKQTMNDVVSCMYGKTLNLKTDLTAYDKVKDSFSFDLLPEDIPTRDEFNYERRGMFKELYKEYFSRLFLWNDKGIH